MKKPLTFYADAKDGKFSVHKKDLFVKYLATLKGLVSIQIVQRKAKRSLNQNAYYWVCLSIIGDELGYTKEEMHGIFGMMYLKEYTSITNGKTGEIIEIEMIRSTTTLNKVEFGEYLNRIIQWAAEMGVILLTPEEFYETDLKQLTS